MDHADMMSFEDAIAVIDSVVKGRVVEAERVPVRDSLNRFLREDLVTRIDVPPFHRSVMDGYAICKDDDRDEYRVIDTVTAGSMPTRELEPGSAIKVMTGAPVPVGAGRVIMIEDTVREGDHIQLTCRRSRNFIAWQGEDMHEGEPLFQTGRLCSVTDIATIYSCGISEISVSRRVRISLLSTGSELVSDFREMSCGKIMNSNGPLMSLLSRQAGMEIIHEESLPDDSALFFRTLQRESRHADIIVLSGGTSAGDHDFVAEALSRMGMTIHFRGVAMKPGRPTIFATGGMTVVFGLPGNPPAVFTAFHLFVLRALSLMAGAEPVERTILLPCAEPVHRSSATCREFIPACITRDGRCARLRFHRSGLFVTQVPATGFLVIPEGTTDVAENDRQMFIPFHPH